MFISTLLKQGRYSFTVSVAKHHQNIPKLNQKRHPTPKNVFKFKLKNTHKKKYHMFVWLFFFCCLGCVWYSFRFCPLDFPIIQGTAVRLILVRLGQVVAILAAELAWHNSSLEFIQVGLLGCPRQLG